MRHETTRMITRRDALLALAAAGITPALMAQQTPPAIRTRRFNNVMIAASDVDRSAAFYEKLFGPPTRQGDTAIFRVGQGPHFFALTPIKAGAKPQILSFGMTVEDFDAQRTARALAELGIGGVELTMRGDTPELFVTDPNGIRVQLVHTAYGYGSGVRGDSLPPQPATLVAPVFRLQTLNHVTLTLKDGPKEAAFYRTAFNLPIRALQGTGATYAIGEGTDGIVFNPMNSNPNAVPGINHICFTIENFDPARVMTTLIANGLEPIETGIPALVKPLTARVRWRQRANNGGGPTSPLGTPELYFTDPDNIPIQLQDVSYCGGSGALGQVCP